MPPVILPLYVAALLLGGVLVEGVLLEGVLFGSALFGSVVGTTLWSFLSPKIYFVGLVLAILAVPIVLLSPKSSQSKVAWILFILGWPWLGLALFAAFGRNRLHRRVVRLRNSGLAALGPVDARVDRMVRRSRAREGALAKDLKAEALETGGTPPYEGNEVKLHAEGTESFGEMGLAVSKAQNHVHVETYIFKQDRTGHEVLDALVDAARRGVEVRLVYDALGSHATKNRFFDPLREAGGEVSLFLPFRAPHRFFHVNLRNHRKLTVVDGHTAFLGGRNIGDEYSSDPLWRDLHAVVRGPAVCGLQRVFLEDWHFATGKLLDDDCYFEQAKVEGDVPLQVLADGPDNDSDILEDLFFSAIAGARERVDLVSPYFVPTEPLLAAIRSSLARGRHVRVLIGRITDNRVVRWAAQSLMADLMEDGLEVWVHPGMVHSKLLVVDDEWGTFGSTNFDARSLRLNFELNVGIPHRGAAVRLREYMDAEIAHAVRLPREGLATGIPGRLLRNAAGLFAPIM